MNNIPKIDYNTDGQTYVTVKFSGFEKADADIVLRYAKEFATQLGHVHDWDRYVEIARGTTNGVTTIFFESIY